MKQEFHLGESNFVQQMIELMDNDVYIGLLYQNGHRKSTLKPLRLGINKYFSASF